MVNLNLKDYLGIRVKRNGAKCGVVALSSNEARQIGIPWPLSKGWAKEYGNREVPHPLVENAQAGKSNRRIPLEERRLSKAKKKAARELRRKVAKEAPNPVRKEIPVASDAFLQTYEWRRIRMQAIKKYGTRCMCCGATPADGAVMNVDHIKPRRLFPALALDLDNLQILCHECNHGKGNWDMTDWRPVEGRNKELASLILGTSGPL